MENESQINSEKELQKQVKYLNLLIDNLNEILYTYDENGRFTLVNRKFCEVSGYTPGDIIGRNIFEFVPEAEKESVRKRIQERLVNGNSDSYEVPVICNDCEHLLRVNAAAIMEDGVFKGGMVLAEDIGESRRMEKELQKAHDELENRIKERTAELETINQVLNKEIAERKLVEQALLESQQQLKLRINHLNMLMDNLNELFFIYDQEGYISFVNQKSMAVLGYKPEEMKGMNISCLTTQENQTQMLIEKEKRLCEGLPSTYEIPLMGKDGYQRIIRFNSAPVFIDGEIVGGMALGEDITAYCEALEALKISEEKYSAAFRLSPEMIAISTLEEGRYIEVNDTFLKLFDYSREEVIGKTVKELNIWAYPQGRREITRKLMQQPILRNVEDIFNKKSGGYWRGLCSFSRLNLAGETCILTVAADITEKRRMEEELLKATKLESLGVLAGGLAHDFNNLLTIIVGNIALAKMLGSNNQGVEDFLLEAEKATLQARGLTQQLLTFARGGAPIKKAIALSKLLREQVSFCLSGSNVRSELDISEELWNVEVDEHQFNQVLNNLVLNAVQSMPDGGLIQIKAENIVLCDFEWGLPLIGGKYVKLSVKDHGTGISEENRNKIFDPYFTTKKGGNGLGLATSYSIINRHGGHLCCESKLGAGSIFFIYLPAFLGTIDYELLSQQVPLRGAGKILVMDDDERIRETLNGMLHSLGYEVEMAADGQACIDIYHKHMQGDRFAVVIMDLTVPGGMGGKIAVKKLLDIDPSARVIASSGYSNDLIMAKHQRWGFAGVIAKPYGIEELSQVLHQVITN